MAERAGAMALAKINHHAAPQGQNMARAQEEGHGKKHNAPWRQKPPPHHADAGTQTEDDAEHTVVIPQERNFERTIEQTIEDMKRPEIEYVAPALAVARRRRLALSVAPAPVAAYAAPAPVAENVASSPSVTSAASAPVTECAST